MKKFIETFDKRKGSSNPENGTRRIQRETDGINHLQIFYNGSWRHDIKCKLKTNKDCTIEIQAFIVSKNDSKAYDLKRLRIITNYALGITS